MYTKGKNLFIEFKVAPTFEKNVKIVNNRGKTKGSARDYTNIIEVKSYKAFLEEPISQSSVREMLKKSDVYVDCNCPSFHWTGVKYEISGDASISKTSIPNVDWSQWNEKNYGVDGSPKLCKHLYQTLKYVQGNVPKITKDMKELE